MEFEDFFEKKHKYHKKHKMHNYDYDDSHNHESFSVGHGSFKPYEFINSLKNNKKLKTIIIVGVIIIIAVLIGLISLLFPLLTKLFNYISQNGISGIYEIAMNFIDKLWNGVK